MSLLVSDPFCRSISIRGGSRLQLSHRVGLVGFVAGAERTEAVDSAAVLLPTVPDRTVVLPWHDTVALGRSLSEIQPAQ